MFTTKTIAARAGTTWASALFVIFSIGLGGCASSFQSERQNVYDFGPGPLANTPSPASVKFAPLILGLIEASPALESKTVNYRLNYAVGQQLKPYSQARWSMEPAQLLRQRLSEQLGPTRTILNPGESGTAGAEAPATLRVDLEEFSQLFLTPSESVGLIRLRATLIQPSKTPRVTQHSIVVQRPAPSANAIGGVQALTQATDAALLEVDQWLRVQAP